MEKREKAPTGGISQGRGARRGAVMGTLIFNIWHKVVGPVIDDTFYKKLHSDQFYREIPGITYSWDVMRAAMNAGATKLHVTNIDTGTIYRSTVELFWQEGPKYGEINHGLGPHYCLPYEFWEIEEPAVLQPALL